MTDFTMFMAGNAIQEETTKYIASKRYLDKNNPVLDENGQPTGKFHGMAWEIKAIDSDQDEAIRKDCTKRVPLVGGKRGQYTQETDTDKYVAKMCVACTVYPNLNDATLQDSYGVKSADALLKKMLLPGEYTEYKAKVMEINGYDMSMEDLVEEAKN